MEETKDIDEFLTTLGRPQSQYNHSCLCKIFETIDQSYHMLEGPILNVLWHSPQGKLRALGPGFISTEPLSISSSWMILHACVLVMFKVVWYCKGYFLAFNHVFLHRKFHNLLCVDQLYFCVMISHMLILKQICIRLFTNKTVKRNKLSNTWSTIHWIPNSMYSWSMVNLPNVSVCWGNWCVDHMCWCVDNSMIVSWWC